MQLQHLEGSNWSKATRILQNVRNAFGIPALTKSCFGKNQSYKALTPDPRYVHASAESIT